MFSLSLLSGQEKGFDKTLCVSPRTYGGQIKLSTNHTVCRRRNRHIWRYNDTLFATNYKNFMT